MKRLNKKAAIRLANQLVENRFLHGKGMVEEGFNDIAHPDDRFGIYKSQVIEKLVELESGQKLIDLIGAGHKDGFIKSNMELGFSSQKTAYSIRDHWYGVG